MEPDLISENLLFTGGRILNNEFCHCPIFLVGPIQAVVVEPNFINVLRSNTKSIFRNDLSQNDSIAITVSLVKKIPNKFYLRDI